MYKFRLMWSIAPEVQTPFHVLDVDTQPSTICDGQQLLISSSKYVVEVEGEEGRDMRARGPWVLPHLLNCRSVRVAFLQVRAATLRTHLQLNRSHNKHLHDGEQCDAMNRLSWPPWHYLSSHSSSCYTSTYSSLNYRAVRRGSCWAWWFVPMHVRCNTAHQSDCMADGTNFVERPPCSRTYNVEEAYPHRPKLSCPSRHLDDRFAASRASLTLCIRRFRPPDVYCVLEERAGTPSACCALVGEAYQLAFWFTPISHNGHMLVQMNIDIVENNETRRFIANS
jgi:hypothetical protein